MQQVYMATLGRDSTVSIREWELRFNTAKQYLSLLRNHLDVFDFDQTKYNNFRLNIEKVLNSLDGRKGAILESLSN
jgi:hypothetical protein